MAKVAILSDIHGNLPAFTAVLREVDQCSVDLIVFGGDIVGYGASPGECIRYVRSLGGHCVLGNHELYLNEASSVFHEFSLDSPNPVEVGIAHALRSVTEDDLAWIRDLPWFLPIDDETVITHAALHEPQEWPYIQDGADAELTIEVMRKRRLDLTFVGHVHQLAIYPVRDAWSGSDIYRLSSEQPSVVTVGSVGQSREKGDLRAAWVLFDSDDRTVEFKRTVYPCHQSAHQIIEAGLPMETAMRVLGL